MTAPAAAPDDNPNRNGSARSLRVSVCKTQPTMPSPAPMIVASNARGNLKSRTILLTGLSLLPLRITSTTLEMPSGVEPTTIAIRVNKNTHPKPMTSKPVIRILREATSSLKDFLHCFRHLRHSFYICWAWSKLFISKRNICFILYCVRILHSRM